MIEKIIEINSIGRFTSFKIDKDKWDGNLKENNVIYGENGVGKTTLSLILKSLKGKDHLINKKETFGCTEKQFVNLILDGNSVKFKDNSWEKYCSDIEVFDIHFVEDNIYTGSALLDKNKTNLFEIIVGEEGINLKKQLSKLYHQKNSLKGQSKRVKNKLKYEKNKLDKDEITYLEVQREKFKEEIKTLTEEIRKYNIELGEYSQQIFEEHIDEINYYLKFFTPYIELKKFSKINKGGKQFVSYYLLLNGQKIVFDQSNNTHPSVKYSLSEGDKSALALSFFLARIKISGELENKIIVFDDPISSFDSSRRNSTINQLVKLSKKVSQMIVLTHDIHFAKDLSKRFYGTEVLNLKMVRRDEGSEFVLHNIEEETLTGVFKDISVLKNYLTKGADTDLEKREVIRCIRPIIEGILRVKFFTVISKNEWLGDILGKIRNSEKDDKLFRLKNHLDELSEINEYSKSFHHSDPTQLWGEVINDEELRIYVNRTLNLVEKI